MIAHVGKLAATTALVLMAGASGAFAADAEAFATRLKALMSEQGATMTYSSATSEGDNVILEGVTFTDGEDTNEVGTLTFETVTGSTAEGWSVERVPIADVSSTEEKTTVSATGMVVEGLELIGTEAGDDAPAAKQVSPIYFDAARIGGMTVTRAGNEIFTLADGALTNEIADDGTFTGEFTSGNFTVNFPEDDPAEAPKTMRDIGYESLSGTLSAEASWEPDSGRLALAPVSFDLENAGELSMTFAIDGYTREVGQSLQQIQQQMAANPDNQNAGMAIMGLLAQLSVESAQISFDDDSLTERLLKYYADEAGQTPEQVAEGASQMVTGLAASLQNPQFQQQVTDAVASFLKDPQSITIAVAPQQPIPAMQIVGAVMGAPQSLPQVLSLSVTANGQ